MCPLFFYNYLVRLIPHSAHNRFKIEQVKSQLNKPTRINQEQELKNQNQQKPRFNVVQLCIECLAYIHGRSLKMSFIQSTMEVNTEPYISFYRDQDNSLSLSEPSLQDSRIIIESPLKNSIYTMFLQQTYFPDCSVYWCVNNRL